MSKTHYEVLEVSPTSSSTEIRASYRRLVSRHHPDRSPSPESARILNAVMLSYEVLSDPIRRANYDTALEHERVKKANAAKAPAPRKPSAPKAAPRPGPQAARPPGGPGEPVAVRVAKLTTMYARGKFGEAEDLARAILQEDSRQAVPYAILGDMARMRKNLKEASKMYAYAVQMDPRNSLYQRRHEELLDAVMPQDPTPVGSARPVGQSGATTVLVGFGLVAATMAYVMMSTEKPALPNLKLMSTWTLGLMLALFFSGVATGASLALANILDRFQSTTTTTIGKTSPNVALGFVAIVNFWVALLLYALIGLSQRSLNFSTSRIMGAVASITIAMSMVATVTLIHPGQVLVWGGNLVYVGSLCGWLVADSLRS